MTLQAIKNREFKTTKDNKRLSQAAGIELKNIVTDLVKDALIASYPELNVIRGANSLLLMIDNDLEGALPLEVTIVNKPLDIDDNDFAEQYQEKLKKEFEKQQKKELLRKKVT